MESNRCEYKRELTDGFEREAIAFLNYRDGGVIYIGIDRDGAVVGVANCDAVQLAIKDRQVAKYRGLDRCDLIDSNEYGYCSLIKTCKQVLDRLDVENRTATRITSKERINRRLWDAVALREAVVNAIIHNDYASEAVPKFEIFSDRLEITSGGAIPLGVAGEEFFAGYSIPRNKILMRVFKDLDIVEYLGSGMPRILRAYAKESFIFTGNFIRMVLPISLEALELEQNTTGHVGLESGLESRLESKTSKNVLRLLTTQSLQRAAIAQALGHDRISGAINRAIKELLGKQLIEYTIPDKPNSRLQKYRLTTIGKALLVKDGDGNE